MTLVQKKQMGELLKLYQHDVSAWLECEEEPEEQKYFQDIISSIDTVLKSFNRSLEVDEW